MSYVDILVSWNPVGEVANMLNNLCMKPGNKIFTYNVDFMYYASQLG